MGPALTRWSPHAPTDPQQVFLDLHCEEALYGGAAGGGKSDALLMAALQYVDTPGYAAVLLRRSYVDLALPGAIMDRSISWLAGTGARWDSGGHTWHFPSGATVTFGYLEAENSKYRYQSSEFQMVGFDELTQFSETQYVYLFSRLRRLRGSEIPIRMRTASNPGGVGHDWVRQRFVASHEDAERVFVPARLVDNPYIDRTAYTESLNKLDAVTRAQLLEGNWDVLPQGDLFKREYFEILPERPAFLTHWVRYWDKAGTKGAGDWTAGVLIGRAGAAFYVLDVVKGQWSADQRNEVMKQTTRLDARVCPRYSVWVEQEPGSGGKESAELTVADLAGHDVHKEPVSGSKLTRARPFAAQCEVGNVKLISGSWNSAYLTEVCAFTGDDKKDVHDDQVDASSGAFNKLCAVQHSGGSEEYAR